MFSQDIIESDDFSSLPHASQVLYFHLNLVADDDGMVGNPRRVIRSLGIAKKHYDTLIEEGYIIEFPSKVIAISDWLIHNQIRRDRYTPTRYLDEFQTLKTEPGSRYIKGEGNFFGNQTATEVSIEELKKEEKSLNKSTQDKKSEVELPTHKFTDTLTEDERRQYNKFLNDVKLYFMKNHGTQEIAGFIAYNEKRHWQGKRGESVIENYRSYVDEWLRK